jgi:hypothetical protein
MYKRLVRLLLWCRNLDIWQGFYFASVETNGRGAPHLHGHLWLDANMHPPTLLKDMAKPENEDYREQVCGYIDLVFLEVR